MFHIYFMNKIPVKNRLKETGNQNVPLTLAASFTIMRYASPPSDG